MAAIEAWRARRSRNDARNEALGATLKLPVEIPPPITSHHHKVSFTNTEAMYSSLLPQASSTSSRYWEAREKLITVLSSALTPSQLTRVI
jgi:hypothetical protein